MAKVSIEKLLGSLKNKKVLYLILVICGVVVALLWTLDTRAPSKNVVSQSNTVSYLDSLESRLCSVLSSISGAGEVSCMITLDGEIERIVAYTDDEKKSSSSNTTSSGATNSSNTSTVSKEPVLITVNGKTEPLVLHEVMPPIRGVVVVAGGADNIKVKLDILKAVQALLKVDSSQVEIFTKQNNKGG